MIANPSISTKSAPPFRATSGGTDGTWLLLAARLTAWVVLTVAVAVLFAWVGGFDLALSLMPGLPVMNFSTALGLALLAFSLLAQTGGLARGVSLTTNRGIATGAALGTGLIGVLTMAEMLTGVLLGFEELLVSDLIVRASASPLAPAQMSLATATALLLLTVAMLAGTRNPIGPSERWTVRACAASAAAIGLLAGTALLLSVGGLAHVPFFSTMPLHTAWLIVLLGVGAVLLDMAGRRGAHHQELDVGRQRSERRLAMSLLATLALGLTITLAIGHRTQTREQEIAQIRFDRATQRIVAEGRRRLELAVYGLKGARGAYAASKSVERPEFRSYVASRDLRQEFPGVLGFGFIQRVFRDDLPSFIAAERADEAADFNVRTLGDAPDLFVIKFIEPLAPNRAAWGYDAGSEPHQRAAIEQAIRTGEPTLTRRIALVQDESNHAGFLFLLPVYRNGTHPRTESERIDSLQGLVFAPLRIDEIFAGVACGAEGDLDFEVFEGPASDPDALLFEDDGTKGASAQHIPAGAFLRRLFQTSTPLKVGGRTWTFRTSSTPAFESRAISSQPLMTTVAGLLLSTLATGVVWMIGRAMARAIELAEARKANESSALIALQNTALSAMAERAHHVVDDVSHEFRTPLAVIKEFASVIADGIAGPVSAQQTEYLKIMDGAVVDLNHMVEDLLDSSKLRAGRLRVDRREHRVEAIFAAGRAAIERKASSRSIVIEECIEPGLPAIFADEEKVRRIISNLLTNAVKFSPEGGTIILSARSSTRPGEVMICVTDHGPGLSAEDVDRLFGRFQQLSTARSVAAKGFGLGLSIAQELSWLNLGQLSVVSNKGEGAAFSFTLPAHDPQSVLDHYFESLAGSDRPSDELALLRVTASTAGAPSDPGEPREFLAAATYPTDLIVPCAWAARDGTTGEPPRSWYVVGRTRSPGAWAQRLRSARAQLISDSSLTLLALAFDVQGAWQYPARADLAREAVERAVGLGLSHAE